MFEAGVGKEEEVEDEEEEEETGKGTLNDGAA